MANKAYVGVNNIAKKVKNGYVGVRTAFPIYQTQTTTETVNVVGSNIGLYFNTSFSYFGWLNTTFKSNNNGVANSTSQAILTALQDCTVTYTYNYGTEANYVSIIGVTNKYDVGKEFPMITLRNNSQTVKRAIDEVLWIWQKKSNNVKDLGSHIWDQWANEEGSI